MLVTADERKPFEKKMGETLVAKLKEAQLDSTIFIVANLHNSGSPPTTPEESAQIAKLNLKAANHAATMSALEMASMYATTGIDLLPNDKWEREYDLTKSLYATACRVESCLGNHSRVVTLSNEVLGRSDTPIMEQLPIFLAKVAILESQDGRFPEAIDVCLDVLKRLGCKFPRSKFGQLTNTIGGIISINFTTKKLTPKAISEIPIVEDKKLIATMQILDKLGALCIISASPLFPLVAFRSLELTLKHGLCETSPAAFALVGMLLVAVSGDLQGGSVYANHALSLMQRLPNHEAIEARTMFLSHFFVLPWTQPLNCMVKPLLRAYEVGLMTGDIDSAVYAIGTYVTIAIIAGRPLEGLLDDCRVYFGQMRQLGR
jgi:predicted ATPase